MKIGEKTLLRIEKPAAGGWMIARAQGHVILVSGVLPGELVTIQIDRIGKGVAYGHATSIEEPSPDRQPAFVDQACGGCLYAHVRYARQRTLKSEVITDALTRIGRIAWTNPVVVAGSPAEGYRMRGRLHVRDGRVGFFREGTHELCSVRTTRQLLPDTCDVIEEVERRFGTSSLRGEMELSENVDATERALHLDTAEPMPPEQWATATVGLPLTGVTQSTAGRPAMIVAGSPYVTDVVTVDGHDVRLRRHVQAFFQGNRYLLRDLATHVLAFIEPNASVVDLYAGAGLFSVAAGIVKGAHVVAVEGDRVSAADLVANASATAGAVAALHQSVEDFVARHHPPPAVLTVDPPRTGMSKDAVRGAIRLRARTVVYVSCDVATLARDIRRFVDAGYSIASIAAFDLFPNTPHVETVVALHAA